MPSRNRPCISITWVTAWTAQASRRLRSSARRPVSSARAVQGGLLQAEGVHAEHVAEAGHARVPVGQHLRDPVAQAAGTRRGRSRRRGRPAAPAGRADNRAGCRRRRRIESAGKSPSSQAARRPAVRALARVRLALPRRSMLAHALGQQGPRGPLRGHHRKPGLQTVSQWQVGIVRRAPHRCWRESRRSRLRHVPRRARSGPGAGIVSGNGNGSAIARVDMDISSVSWSWWLTLAGLTVGRGPLGAAAPEEA